MTAVIALPALANMLMVLGLLPMDGVTFPFLAYGGSAVIVNAEACADIAAMLDYLNKNTKSRNCI